MPKLHESLIHRLHPTQLTVGMREVHDKKKRLTALSAAEQREFMRARPIPAVLGPGDRLYITDHHHLGRAAYEAGVETGFFEIVADLSACDRAGFWARMDEEHWVHPLDAAGVRHRYAAIPDHLEQLVDDAYRSLAGYVRDRGGFAKTPAAFAEFVWADFFRRTIAVEDLEHDFAAAVETALRLARSEAAHGLPGHPGTPPAAG